MRTNHLLLGHTRVDPDYPGNTIIGISAKTEIATRLSPYPILADFYSILCFRVYGITGKPTRPEEYVVTDFAVAYCGEYNKFLFELCKNGLYLDYQADRMELMREKEKGEEVLLARVRSLHRKYNDLMKKEEPEGILYADV